MEDTKTRQKNNQKKRMGWKCKSKVDERRKCLLKAGKEKKENGGQRVNGLEQKREGGVGKKVKGKRESESDDMGKPTVQLAMERNGMKRKKVTGTTKTKGKEKEKA